MGRARRALVFRFFFVRGLAEGTVSSFDIALGPGSLTGLAVVVLQPRRS